MSVDDVRSPRIWREWQAWPPGLVLVLLVVVSRLLIMEAGALAYLYLPLAWVTPVPGYISPVGSQGFQALLGAWAHWDGYWYLSIARFGYAGRPLATAFFPLYPLLVRTLGSSVPAAVCLSLAAFGGGLYGLYRLVSEEFSPRVAWYAVLSLAYFPTSFYFNSVYPEALVLLLSVWSFYLARRGLWWWSALVAGLASAASLDGLILAMPLALYLWAQRERWWHWLSLLLVPTGLLVYMTKLYTAFGSPLTFESVQHNWGRSFSPILPTLWSGFRDFLANVPTALSPSHLFSAGEPLIVTSNAWNFVFALASIVGVVLAIKYLPRPYWVYSLLVTAVPLTDPAATVPLMSAPRFLLAVWPVFVAWGVFVARRPKALAPYLVISLFVGLVLVSLFATAHWVA